VTTLSKFLTAEKTSALSQEVGHPHSTC